MICKLLDTKGFDFTGEKEMNISLGVIVVILLTYVGLTAAQDETSAWSDSFEALTAAPDSHKIL